MVDVPKRGVQSLKPLLALLKAIWIWGLLTWVYVVATVLDPVTAPYLTSERSEYIPVPVDLVGLVAFGVSFIAFVLWEWQK